MKIKSESYPDKIRRIAEDLSQARDVYETDRVVEKLRVIANELERILKTRRGTQSPGGSALKRG